MSRLFIKDIAVIKNGSTPSTKRDDYYGGNIIWITPKDLSNSNSKYIEKGEKNITQLGYESCSTTLIPKGSILLSSRAPIGLLAIAKKELCTNQGFKNLIIDTERVYNEYLYYWLKTKVNYIGTLGTGTTFKEVSKHVIENLEINLPNLQTQKSIAKVLSDIDAKIELNNKINQELEAMAKTLYDYWFVQFDFPNQNGKPYKSSGGKMVYNEELKREIPEGWEVLDLENIEPNIVTGKTPSTKNSEFYDGNIPFITIGDVRGNMHIIKTVQSLSELGANQNPNKFLPKGSICVTCIASPGLVGFVTENSQTNQQINSIICNDKENQYFLYFYIKDYFKFAKASSGSTFSNMNKGDFSAIKTIKPNDEILVKFTNLLEPNIDSILLNQKQNQHLTKLRDWLLPMLMNGQVQVASTAQEDVLGMVAEPEVGYKKL